MSGLARPITNTSPSSRDEWTKSGNTGGDDTHAKFKDRCVERTGQVIRGVVRIERGGLDSPYNGHNACTKPMSV